MDSVIDDMPTMISAAEIHRKTDLIINEVATRVSDKAETFMLEEKQTLMQVVTSVEDVVLVEDAFDDEKVVITSIEDVVLMEDASNDEEVVLDA